LTEPHSDLTEQAKRARYRFGEDQSAGIRTFSLPPLAPL